MNKKTLIAGLTGFVIGALTIPDQGWLIGALIGGLLGQLLHLGDRLQDLEQKLNLLKGGAAEEPPAREPLRPTPAVQESPKAPPPPSVTISSPPVPVSASAPSTPAYEMPKFLAKLLDRARRFFFEGNPIVRVGMVVMLFGLGFLVKYAASAGLFPIHLRLAAVALIAIALLVIGWRTREKRSGYGLVLQGGGIAALYLTVFAATKLYLIFPPALAFALMLLIVCLGVLLAVLQNAQVLAVMSTAGGFLAPILTSDGSGNHVLLFSFYLLLNLGVLGIALFKTWRWLNWIGFLFTFAISSAWGVLSYEPEFYRSTQPFLLAFFLLYLGVSVLFSIKQAPQRRGLVDGSLIFGLPIVSFGLQAALLSHTDYGLALSAIVLAAIYMLLATTLWKRYGTSQRLLIESFIALCVGFATIAVPLALDADWTSATWALEAAGLIWVGLRQQRIQPRIAGYGLYLAAVISIFINGAFDTGSTPIVSGDFMGFAILSFAAFAAAYLLWKYRNVATRSELSTQWLPIAAGLLWWLSAGFNEIAVHVQSVYHFAALVAFSSASFGVVVAVASALRWTTLARATYSLLPLIILTSLPFGLVWLVHFDDPHPAANFGLLALLLFGMVQYGFLQRHGNGGSQALLSVWQVATAWLWLVLLFWEAAYWQQKMLLGATASLLLWFACFAAPIILLTAVADKQRWPFSDYRAIYKDVVPIPAVILLLFWFVVACRHSAATPYLHLPLFNPLDLAQLAVLLILAYAGRNRLAGLHRLEPALRYGGLAVLAFAWINVAVMRAVHHYSLVPYELQALWASATVQMALSIVWTLCALAIMVFVRRLQSRAMWMLGAGLLVLVVIKLFTKDLTGSGTLPRVISFMAVGALMLLIGYLSPMPANKEARLKEAT